MADNEYIKRDDVVELIENAIRKSETVHGVLVCAHLRTAVMGLRSADVAPRAEIDKLQEVNADLNEPLRLAAEANKDLDAKAENLAYKLGCLLCHATGGRLSNHTYDLLTMEKAVTDYLDETYREGKEEGYKNAKAEVAREIFEEIENIANGFLIKDNCAIISLDKLAALKNKYTEEK